MNLPEIIINTIIFLIVSSWSFVFFQYLEKRYNRYITSKRFNTQNTATKPEKNKPLPPTLNRFVLSLGRVAAPKSNEDISKTAKKLSHAGYRQDSAPTLFYGSKLGIGILFATIFFFSQIVFNWISFKTPLLIFIPFGIGYFLPDIILKNKIKSRVETISRELPDTLDLLEICLKAGLGFDYALFRVCNELKDIAPVMSLEFGRYFLEIKTGIRREKALTNLGLRNGSDPLKKVINVFLQSSKIGSDMAQALKIYTDTIRREREQVAEEQGAKLGTKLTLPLVIFILPALMLIIMGPVIINFLSLVKTGF